MSEQPTFPKNLVFRNDHLIPELIHYILIRRDLPVGTAMAMVAHAAADSAESWARSWFRYKRKHLPITVVVLGVEDKKALLKAYSKLKSQGLMVVVVRDTLPESHLQMLAVGVEPGDREFLAPFFKSYQIYKEKSGNQ